jgi:hypothetical protein
MSFLICRANSSGEFPIKSNPSCDALALNSGAESPLIDALREFIQQGLGEPSGRKKRGPCRRAAQSLGISSEIVGTSLGNNLQTFMTREAIKASLARFDMGRSHRDDGNALLGNSPEITSVISRLSSVRYMKPSGVGDVGHVRARKMALCANASGAVGHLTLVRPWQSTNSLRFLGLNAG